MKQSKAYPQPGPVGGELIRSVISLLRRFHIALPFTSDILVACSGGSDSAALALLLAKYGRRVAEPERLTLLHINHGWRGKASDGDEAWVLKRAKEWGVRARVVRLAEGRPPTGESWENWGRQMRQAVFSEFCSEQEAWVLTAHQADDLAETLLWRLFTGAGETHGAGILVQSEREIRPFLTTRKAALRAFLQEEGVDWREDETNTEGRLLRSRMRKVLMPEVESLFPQAIERLVEQGLRAGGAQAGEAGDLPLAELFGRAGLRAKRAHHVWARGIHEGKKNPSGSVNLPKGWSLSRHVEAGSREGQILERWVLEREVQGSFPGPGQVSKENISS